MATFTFPEIKQISDVLPAIKDMKEFCVGDGSEYFDVVDYHIMDSHTFKDDDPALAAIRRECRGLLFHKDGRIARRAFHKFFNVGETEETFADNIDLSQGYYFFEKLDGSMIAPFISETLGSIYWASMRGSYRYHERLAALYDGTSHAKLVEALANKQATAIFEFCSPENRVVVGYAAPQLTLLAIRELYSGRYYDRTELESLGAEFGVPVVQLLDHTTTASVSVLLSEIANVKGMEGAVLWMDGRPLAKFKGEWYLQLHKLLGYFKFEKDIARLVLSGNSDDLMGILTEPKRKALIAYQDELLAGIKQAAHQCSEIVDDIKVKGIERKEFATEYETSQAMKGFIFRYFGRFENAKFFDDIIAKGINMTTSFSKWDQFKSSIGLELDWAVENLD